MHFSSSTANPQGGSSNYNEIRTTPDASQSPQASASTNSAIRASYSVVDGVSQENGSKSSDRQLSIKFPVWPLPQATQQVNAGKQTTYATEPTFEAPRAKNRWLQRWTSCVGCSRWYAAPTKELNRGRRVFCSIACCGEHAKRTKKFAGDKNPRWLGGVSKDNMRYRRRSREKWPEHEAARSAVRAAVRNGSLVRLPCEHCGATKSNGHHEDYSKPLVVIWLCRPCHDAEHARLKAMPLLPPTTGAGC